MIFQACISVLLIIMVLLQFGKGAEAGLFSGGGASESLSTGGGNILSKVTVVLAVLFLGNSILLAKIQTTNASKSLLDGEAPVARPLNSDAATKKAEDKSEATKVATPKTEAKKSK